MKPYRCPACGTRGIPKAVDHDRACAHLRTDLMQPCLNAPAYDVDEQAANLHTLLESLAEVDDGCQP